MVRRQNPASPYGLDSDVVSACRRRLRHVSLSQVILVAVVLAPGVVFALLSFSWLLGWVPGEGLVSKLTGGTFSLCVLGLSVLVWKLAAGGSTSVVVTFGDWFAVQDYRFPLVLIADHLSLP